jgi:hypothetical protein
MGVTGRVVALGGRGRKLGGALLVIAAFVAVSLFAIRPVTGTLGSPSTAAHLYVQDADARLFDNFDGVTFADSRAGQTSFVDGYLQGFSIFLPDTASWVQYSDSWWASHDDQLQESGTLEMYFRPETFVFATPRPYGTLVTVGERAITPVTGGMPTLAVSEAGGLSWAVSTGGGGYTDAAYSSDPSLYPYQWYHIAATWQNGTYRLYINNRLVATAAGDTSIRHDTFLLGGTGIVNLAQGWAARGRIDRFRLSSRARALGEFPLALDVRIDSPIGGETLARPFPVKYQASASETRARVVDLYADTDDQNFNGIQLISGLVDSGTALVGANLADADYVLYAVARAGGDSAFFYLPLPVHVVASSLNSSTIDPADTTATIAIPIITWDSFMVVLLNGGGTTSGTLASAVDSTGRTANYAVTSRLMNSADTVAIYIWTREPTGGVMLNVRSDTASLNAARLPRGIPANEPGLRAFGATVISTEFLRSNGTIIGDTISTSYIGDSYAYALEYRFSATTTGWLAAIGFDTTPGSRSFSFFYADTYGADWREDTLASVSVYAGSAGGIIVRVSPITRDLPGGLGFAASSQAMITSSSGSSVCMISRMTSDGWILELLRAFRDWMLGSCIGRSITSLYYSSG